MTENSCPTTSNRETFEALPASGVVLLTSFRRDGQGVGTPVGIRLQDGKAYFATRKSTFKVGRIAADPQVKLAPCTRSGELTGPATEGIAWRLVGEEAERFFGRVGLWGRLWMLAYKLISPGDRWLAYEVSPSEEPAPQGRNHSALLPQNDEHVERNKEATE